MNLSGLIGIGRSWTRTLWRLAESALGRPTVSWPAFQSLPAKARVYVVAVVVAGAGCLVATVLHLRLDQAGLFVMLLGLGLVTSVAKIQLPLGTQSALTVSHTIFFWALLALGTAPTVCIGSASAWAQSIWRQKKRNPPHRILFNVATLMVTVTLAGIPLALMGPDTSTVAGLVHAAAVVAPVFFLVNTGLVAGAIAVATQQPVARVWHRDFLWSAPAYLAGAGLAAAATAAWTRGSFGWLALLAVPLYVVFRSFHTVVARLQEERNHTHRAMEVQLATIEALALAIDAKAGGTPEHIRSIQRSATMLAEAAGLSEGDVQAVRTAALLHDIGNLAVPEHILSKPEALTPVEFERVKIHPRVGAEILRKVPFAAPVSNLVLCHHERWDGQGYPAGLRGEDIPVGARILAIADCYSTLQADRPYRKARTVSAALAVLRESAGAAFDPALVELLIAQLTMSAPLTTDTAEGAGPDTEPLALRDIAGAHREEQTLYELAQALGSSLGVAEAMALIQDKVSRLVPLSTCALFLRDREGGYVCRYAHGPGSDALLKWTPKSSSNLSLRFPPHADAGDRPVDELTAMLPCLLTFEGRLIGGLVIYHTVAGCYTDEDRRILSRLSEQAAAVIYNSTRFEQTEHESHTDALTGMANRRSLDRQFEAVLAQAAPTESSISVVVLDLDGLKEINDTYGHEAGDRALHAVGEVLRALVRQHDLCARFAGDEFVVVLRDCGLEHQARRVAELQAAVAAYPFEPRPGLRFSLSISAGAARFPEDGRTFEALLATGDERMYRDKAGRRSRNSAPHTLPLNKPA